MVIRRDTRGAFLLVDAIVGTILLAIALVGMLGLLGSASASQRRGEELAGAAMLADEQLNLVLARGPDDYGSRYSTTGPCDAPFEQYQFRLTFSGGTGGDAYRVRATIMWRSAGGTDRALAVETLIAPRLGDEPDPDRRPIEPVERLQ